MQLARKAMSMSNYEMQNLERMERITKRAYQEEVPAGPMASNTSGAPEEQKGLHFAQCLIAAEKFAKVLRRASATATIPRQHSPTIKHEITPRHKHYQEATKAKKNKQARESE